MASKKSAPKSPSGPPPSERSLMKAHESFRDGNYTGALVIANQILARDPGNTDALILASQCHSLQGRYDRAVAFDRRAVELHPHGGGRREVSLSNRTGMSLAGRPRIASPKRARHNRVSHGDDLRA